MDVNFSERGEAVSMTTARCLKAAGTSRQTVLNDWVLSSIFFNQ